MKHCIFQKLVQMQYAHNTDKNKQQKNCIYSLKKTKKPQCTLLRMKKCMLYYFAEVRITSKIALSFPKTIN